MGNIFVHVTWNLLWGIISRLTVEVPVHWPASFVFFNYLHFFSYTGGGIILQLVQAAHSDGSLIPSLITALMEAGKAYPPLPVVRSPDM